MRFLTLFILLFLLSCTDSQKLESKTTAQDNPNSAKITQEPGINRGLTHIYFDAWEGAKVLVYVYVPWNVDPQTAPVMFMMHGAKRNAARYLSEWDEIAEQNQFIVVAPEFSREYFPKSAQYNNGNIFKEDDTGKNPESLWTFSVIEPLFDHVVKSVNGQQKSYTLYGHSAGSQFTHRYLMFKPEARVKRYLPANAGWYTFADMNIDYPYGLRGSGVSEDVLKAALQKDVVLLLGDEDNDPNHKSLKRSDNAMVQGTHRFARGKAYYANAKANAEKYGVKFGWKMRIINDVAHSNGGIAAKSGDLIH